MKTAFLDSSTLFSATNSPTGGSSKLFTFKKVKLISSPTVLTEVERNVRKKLQSHHLDRFFMLVDKMIIIDQKPNSKLIKKAKQVIVQKDAIILSEGKLAKSNLLITLDQKHFLNQNVANFLNPQKVLTPKMLIEKLESSKNKSFKQPSLKF